MGNAMAFVFIITPGVYFIYVDIRFNDETDILLQLKGIDKCSEFPHSNSRTQPWNVSFFHIEIVFVFHIYGTLYVVQIHVQNVSEVHREKFHGV